MSFIGQRKSDNLEMKLFLGCAKDGERLDLLKGLAEVTRQNSFECHKDFISFLVSYIFFFFYIY
jgi:hypothetical protein